jgi:putative membrane protein
MKSLSLLLSLCFLSLSACASDQKRAPTSEEVAEGEALPPPPAAPAQPASIDTPAASVAPAASASSAAPEPMPAPEALTEAQMAKLSELVNTAEVDQAKLAQRRAKAPAVKQFAAMMVNHHNQALREQSKLVKKLNLSPADSATAMALRSDSQKTLETLKSAPAADFDAAYLKSQVDGHQKVLDLLDTQLLPSAKTPEVADALRKGRTAVEEHLSEARALQAK